jgi:hypothetical protein
VTMVGETFATGKVPNVKSRKICGKDCILNPH